jgi:benzoylformate decarboxylase
MGPVYVCLPQDILDEINDEAVTKTCIPSTRVRPDDGLVAQSADMLLAAERPMIYMGDGICYSNAEAALTGVAEILGAEVWGVDVGDHNMDTTHPCYQGTTGHMFGSHSLPITRKGDVNLIVGTYMVPEVFPELGDIYAEQAKVIHIDLNAYEIAKNHRVDLGVVSDPKLTLEALLQALETKMSPAQREDAGKRVARFREEKEKTLKAEIEADEAVSGGTPLRMADFARVLADKINDDAIIFDEALTNFPPLVRYIPPKEKGSYFVTRGGSLGIGIPGAMGVKVAIPDRQVIGFSGDGGSMYTIQALWSAARHKTGAKFVICNNGSYRLLQLNIDAYWKEIGVEGHPHPLCFDLSSPPIDFAALSRSLGVEAVRVEKPEEIAPAIDRMLADDKPFLIDLVLEGDVHPELIGVQCGQ